MTIKKRRYISIFFFFALTIVVLGFGFMLSPKKGSVNSVGIEFVLIPKGTFEMGCANQEMSPCKDNPLHKVTISRSFYLAKYEVTQAQWYAVMKTRPAKFNGDNLPVERVSYTDAQEFVHKLNQMEKTGVYRLPTESEWEYACRAGTKTLYFFGDNSEELGRFAWYYKNSDHKTHPAGQKEPNKWGLYDMSGNVWEWCSDSYLPGYYDESPPVDPQGPDSCCNKVIRGGSWHSIYTYRMRSCFRFYYNFNGRLPNIGFRIVKAVGGK